MKPSTASTEWSRRHLRWLRAATHLRPFDDVACECGDRSCAEPIELTRSEYEAVRAVSNHFAIAPHHENPESEVVVLENARYAVTAKIDRIAARTAKEFDPRSDTFFPRDARIDEGR